MINFKYLGGIAFLILLLFLIEFTLSIYGIEESIMFPFFWMVFFSFGYCLERSYLKEEKLMNWIETLEQYWDTWEILIVIIPLIIWQLLRK